MNTSRQAAVDPDDLRALAIELSTLSSKILELGQDLDRGLAVLGDTFQDEQYQQFCAAFRGSRQKLKGFAEEVRGLVPKLNQDAEDVTNAQRVRLER